MGRQSIQTLVGRTPRPRTKDSLAGELAKLGVEPGMTVLVHSSLSAIGWVVGGAAAVIEALMEVLGPDGTLAMPAFTPDISDPAEWRDPPIPDAWIEEVRAGMPLFDPARTPTSMGRIAELFRTWPGRTPERPSTDFDRRLGSARPDDHCASPAGLGDGRCRTDGTHL